MPIFQAPQFGQITPSNFGRSLSDAISGYYEAKQYEPIRRYKQAQAEREETLARMPFAGNILPGNVGQIQGLEILKNIYGEDSPQYQRAQNAFDLEQKKIEALMNMQNAMTQTATQRALSPTGKSFFEQANPQAVFGSNYRPSNSDQQLTPEQITGGQITSDKYKRQYELEDLKRRSDPDTRKKLLAATNIDKTLARIDESKFGQYSGALGSAERGRQSLLDIIGKSSTDYKLYKEAQSYADMLAGQVRQFYGESIQPSVREHLNSLTNPTSWKNSPETTLKIFKAFRDLLKNETRTYYDAVKNNQVYEPELTDDEFRSSLANSSQMQQPQEQVTPPGKVNYSTLSNPNAVVMGTPTSNDRAIPSKALPKGTKEKVSKSWTIDPVTGEWS